MSFLRKNTKACAQLVTFIALTAKKRTVCLVYTWEIELLNHDVERNYANKDHLFFAVVLHVFVTLWLVVVVVLVVFVVAVRTRYIVLAFRLRRSCKEHKTNLIQIFIFVVFTSHLCDFLTFII